MLKVNEIFYSVQGEGYHAGTPCIFVRLAGCNLKCKFCDTQHDTYEEYEIADVIQIILNSWSDALPVIITGGEPLMQENTVVLIRALLKSKRKVIVETNGCFQLSTLIGHSGLHISMSPKLPFEKLEMTNPDSIKLLYPFIPGCSLSDYYEGTKVRSNNIFIQPIDNKEEYVREILELLKSHSNIKMSVQIHKFFKLK